MPGSGSHEVVSVAPTPVDPPGSHEIVSVAPAPVDLSGHEVVSPTPVNPVSPDLVSIDSECSAASVSNVMSCLRTI